MAPLWGSGDTSADEPKFTAHHEGMDTSNLTVFGVDETEAGLARTTAYKVSHGGWVGITTYMDNSHNPPRLRVKSETLVAIGITGLDQSDDAVFPE
jgi:hypothetical protein